MLRNLQHRQPPPVSASPSALGHTISARMQEIVAEMGLLPSWLSRYPLTLASPAVRQTLWARGRRITGDQDIGFAFAERYPLEHSFAPWRLLLVAPNIRGSLESFQQWSCLMFEFAELACVEEGALVCVRALPPRGLVMDRAEQDFRVGGMLKMWRAQLRRPLLTPQRVDFSYPRPRSLRAHRTLLGTCELRFEQPALQVCLPRALYDMPLPGHDLAEFTRLHGDMCQAALEHMGKSISARADASLTTLLATRAASAQAVASQLGLSVRTLRRRLSEEKKSFRQLLDEVRRRELELHAEAGLHPLGRLAGLLGFSSDRALRHAVRRWRRRPRIGRF